MDVGSIIVAVQRDRLPADRDVLRAGREAIDGRATGLVAGISIRE
jgi:hypothetical protein